MPSGPLIQIPMVDTTTYEGPNALLNADFEGGVGPASWGLWTSVISRESGARTGGTGLYVGRMAYDGSHNVGLLYQTASIVGAYYHDIGWMRTDGAAVPELASGGGTTYWTGVASNNWQKFDMIYQSAHVNIACQSGNLAAGRWVEADDMQHLPLINVTKNTGLLNTGSSGQYVQMGDGLTPATLPTLIGGGKRGLSNTAVQSLRYGSVPSGVYTPVFLIQKLTTTNSIYLLDGRAGAGTGYFWINAANALETSSGTIYVDAVPSTVLNYGQLALVACAGMTINAPTSLTMLASFLFASGWIGKIYAFELHPGTLTPLQLRAIGERMRSQINLF